MIKVELFKQGQQMAFNDGAQVPVLQHPWFLLWCEHAERNGYDPTKMDIVLNGKKVMVSKYEDGDCIRFNWQEL